MANAAAAKKFKAKKFRVALEGATTDGRIISREWIEQMAKNYNPQKYGARINLEHIKGYNPDSIFKAYGDVISLSTEEFDDAGVKKLALVAELDPTEDLIELNKKRQKVYTSIEVHPDFAKSGEAYLMGLAITDDPASLGTEMLQFSSTAKHNPLASRKTAPECVFTAAHELDMQFEEQGESLGDKIKALFAKNKAEADTGSQAFKQEVEEGLTALASEVQKTQQAQEADKAAFAALQAEHNSLKADYKSLKAKLDNEPNPTVTHHRQPAAGDTGEIEQTDC